MLFWKRFSFVAICSAILLVFAGHSCYGETVDTLNDLIRHNKFAAVERLLKAGINLNKAGTDGILPLSLASMLGNVKMVKILLRYNPNIDIPDAQGKTPIVYSLIGRVVEPNKKSETTRMANQALRQEQSAVCSLLIRNGCNCSHQDTSGLSVLHFAVMYGYPDICRLLIKKNVNVNVQSHNGTTPLHLAARRQYQRDNYLRILIQAGADTTLKDANSKTAFEYQPWAQKQR